MGFFIFSGLVNVRPFAKSNRRNMTAVALASARAGGQEDSLLAFQLQHGGSSGCRD